MAYVDRQSGTSRAASIATVGLIHAALALVLIYGLATKFVPVPKDGPLPTTDFPLPTPTPTTEPTEKPTTAPTDSVVTAPPFPDDFTTGPRVPPMDPFTPPLPPGPTATPTATSGPVIELPPLFTPKAPEPANDRSRWVTTDDYPPRDLRAGHQGTVRFRVAVGTNGRVQSCEVLASSGFDSLDDAACKNVSRRARFEPATNDKGVKVVGTYTGSVIWQIPR